MKLGKDKFEKIVKEFIGCTNEANPVTPGNDWQYEVMEDIRHLGPVGQKKVLPYDLLTPLREMMQQSFWAFAPVACALILFLSIWASKVGVGVEYEMSQFFYDAETEASLYQEFGFDEG